ncbi:MAG: Uncharacterized protein G01um10147_563 [Microgenomates group bacterium Gr01-1014_7]|nr:MAG: Uncharacterized protein G01um10147_563 [Microgenomates group bacterium Gr01-1014_7]
MKRKRVFIDSNVIISSLISETGASHILLNNPELELFVTDKSVEEMEEVADRLSLSKKKLKNLIKMKFKAIKLGEFKQDIENYVLDADDAFILAGSKKARARFLISYNTRHFKADKIAQDLKIVVLTPAQFLQYLRSLQ